MKTKIQKNNKNEVETLCVKCQNKKCQLRDFYLRNQWMKLIKCRNFELIKNEDKMGSNKSIL
jgi:hypothetical protein